MLVVVSCHVYTLVTLRSICSSIRICNNIYLSTCLVFNIYLQGIKGGFHGSAHVCTIYSPAHALFHC